MSNRILCAQSVKCADEANVQNLGELTNGSIKRTAHMLYFCAMYSHGHMQVVHWQICVQLRSHLVIHCTPLGGWDSSDLHVPSPAVEDADRQDRLLWLGYMVGQVQKQEQKRWEKSQAIERPEPKRLQTLTRLTSSSATTPARRLEKTLMSQHHQKALKETIAISLVKELRIVKNVHPPILPAMLLNNDSNATPYSIP
ncbi:uncharacterized protein MYCFIDRAFT_177096 [Pseudocercospora fijiensis CIRAD86]|uniref:Uncharacterized protein n=1 Tax=Pseudocercospora fijiensis (strain CIRAD86) TaxID=383855 RepID=M2ZM24_PSEFD|nr:uncharacterized protein MYCFIDRAFT_177096 [Pseudocercospora fijiensis CIRAD86]EME80119.1 hypothetical protein MYCFIDRAFT_177096 [Pseudocercospora fijiensis CIRAD86]